MATTTAEQRPAAERELAIMSGNEAIARGAWEAGVRFASAYPGTPSTEILESLVRYEDVYCEWAPNEKVAIEAATGARAPAPGLKFLERERRFNDVVALKRPDRVPVIPLVKQYFPTRIQGVSNRDAGYDHAARFRCLKEATLRFDWDWPPMTGVLPSPSLEALGATRVR